jgi:hypothetical protein
MAKSAFHSKPNVDVMLRVFDLPGRGLSPVLAEGILTLDFPEEDAARIQELNRTANEGALTEDEEAELEAYIDIGELLAYWQSRAQQTLHRSA